MKILIRNKVYNKIDYWVQHCDFEVSGFGTAKYDKKTDQFIVDDAILIKQTGGAAHTDIDGQELSKAMFRLKDSGGLTWWWHSHVNMGVFWSGTDEATIKELGGNGWIVASVFNKKHEVKSSLCFKSVNPFNGESDATMQDLETVIELPYTLAEQTAWLAEYDLNVEKKTDTYTNQYNLFNRYGAYENKDTSDDIPNTHDELWQSDAELRAEAAFLGLKVKKYRHILLNGTDEQIQELEAKLDPYYRGIHSSVLTGGKE